MRVDKFPIGFSSPKIIIIQIISHFYGNTYFTAHNKRIGWLLQKAIYKRRDHSIDMPKQRRKASLERRRLQQSGVRSFYPLSVLIPFRLQDRKERGYCDVRLLFDQLLRYSRLRRSREV